MPLAARKLADVARGPIQGPSMSPTLRHGDAVLVRRGGRPTRPGDIVIARFHARPDLLVVKRAVRRAAWWLVA